MHRSAPLFALILIAACAKSPEVEPLTYSIGDDHGTLIDVLVEIKMDRAQQEDSTTLGTAYFQLEITVRKLLDKESIFIPTFDLLFVDENGFVIQKCDTSRMGRYLKLGETWKLAGDCGISISQMDSIREAIPNILEAHSNH